MFIKRFIGKDMQDAIKKIRAEFGPDAIIIDSKQVRGKGIRGIFQKKMLEVVAAYEPGKKNGSKQSDAKQPKKTVDKAVTEKDDEIKRLGDQIANLQETVKSFANTIRVANKETMLSCEAEVLDIYSHLLAEDIQEDIAKKLAQETQRISDEKKLSPKTVAHELIIEQFGEQHPLKIKKFEQNIWMFVGPTGVGKTTSLAKIAGILVLKQHLNVGIINMDTYRIGAMEHIKIYANILDVPLLTAYNLQELEEAKKEFQDKDVILIDTAGKTSADKEYRKEMELMMSAGGVDEMLMVISVSTGLKACREIIKNFSFCDDYKLILTKLDEVSTKGNLLNIATMAKKSLVYFSDGQNVLEDIHEADVKQIADAICERM